MLEQEVKILAIDTEKLVTKLLKYGARRTFSGFITDTVFSHPTRKLSFSIRVRKKNACYYVTFKKRLTTSSYKRALEIECFLPEPHAFMKKIQEQGFLATRITQKMRVSYQIQESSFDIDCYDGIPPFLEIESPRSSLISFWIKQLGLSSYTQLTCGTNGLMKFYNKGKTQ